MSRRAIGPALLAAGLAAAGCTQPEPGPRPWFGPGPQKARQMLARMEAGPAKPHGGTDNVNDAAFDAMFFRHYGVNPYVDADDDPRSTFAVDVDTGSYTLARSYLRRGHLPPRDAVRVEEFVNYFDYGYAGPDEGDDAFAVRLAAAPAGFAPRRTLLRVALQGRRVRAEDRKPAVLTFVVDVSGSMAREDRLGLVRRSLRLLLDRLRSDDRVGIAVYGSRGRKLLDHTGVEDRGRIAEAIDALEPAGSTNAEEGLVIGYRMARRAFREGAINRVVLCSDGVANVGRTGPESILERVRRRAGEGITLSAVGFGMGNYNDVLMEQLADKGDGHYAYVDTLSEARRVFAEQLTGTLELIARDVKVQVEFDPSVVRGYRLIGYENRDVADDDFRDDKVDGGEVGAAHAVTALYELKLWPGRTGRIATAAVRYKPPDGGPAREVARSIATTDVAGGFDRAEPSFRLAAAAAEFAEILRGSYWARGHDLAEVAAAARGCRRGGCEQVGELIELIDGARRLRADAPGEEDAEAPEPKTPPRRGHGEHRSYDLTGAGRSAAAPARPAGKDGR